MNTTAAATYRAAAIANWQLASTYRQLGKVSRSRHYAALAQVYHANAAEAELETEKAGSTPARWSRAGSEGSRIRFPVLGPAEEMPRANSGEPKTRVAPAIRGFLSRWFA